MLAAIFEQDLGVFDGLAALAAVIFAVGAVVTAVKSNRAGAVDWTNVLTLAGLAVLAVAFLFFTP